MGDGRFGNRPIIRAALEQSTPCLESEVKDGQAKTRHCVIRSHEQKVTGPPRGKCGSALLGALGWFKRQSLAKVSAPALKVFQNRAEAPHVHAGLGDDAPPVACDLPVIPLTLAVDRNRRQVMLHSSYTTAAIAGGLLVCVVLVAFIIGKHGSSNRPLVLSDRPLEVVMKSPARSDVLNVGSGPQAKAAEAHDGVGQPPRLSSSGTPLNYYEPSLPMADVRVDTNRVIGRNYAIIASYGDEQIAQASAKFLNDNGIPCTVEHNLHLRGFPQSEFTLVGTTGFGRISANECTAYQAKIDKLSDQFTKVSRGQRTYRAFQHTLYKWDKQE